MVLQEIQTKTSADQELNAAVRDLFLKMKKRDYTPGHIDSFMRLLVEKNAMTLQVYSAREDLKAITNIVEKNRNGLNGASL